MKPTMLVTEKARFENRCSGSTGSVARRSTATKTTSRTAPALAKAIVSDEPQA